MKTLVVEQMKLGKKKKKANGEKHIAEQVHFYFPEPL